jgi:putative addiction module component (TIGR02574 family)
MHTPTVSVGIEPAVEREFVTVRLKDILRLSVPERVQLVEDIWDSIAASPDEVPVTDEQRRELDRRLAAYDPSEARPWSEVRARLEQRE